MNRLILGLNTDHGDSSAALVDKNGIVAAIAEERINRKKHCADFPASAIKEVLQIGGVDIRDITDIAVARDPKANLGQKMAFLARYPVSGLGMARKRIRVHKEVRSTAERIAEAMGIDHKAIGAEFHQVEHHLAHIASAFYWSPYEKCVGFSIDGAGDFATTMWAECQGGKIKILSRSYWPHSLGVFYTGVCQFLGFDRYGEEYKVMGLSAYGKNNYENLMKKLVDFHPKTGLRLNLTYFKHHLNSGSFETVKDGYVYLPQLWADKIETEIGPARKREQDVVEREQDIAASMQVWYEEIFLRMVRALTEQTRCRKIVLAGGCALNSVASGRMLTENYVDDAYFQPAASDDGTAVGAAAYVLHAKYGAPRTSAVTNAFWGTEWSESEIEKALSKNSRSFKRLSREQLIQEATRAIAGGKIIGWFQGREEWGPRALGNRSILCNPAVPDMKATLNARIKNREPFRPFAPVIREEDLSTCFEGSHPVPFMIVVYKVRPEWRAKLPAITHEDNTGRVQTVRMDQNGLLYDLLTQFKELTGVPALLNTSFNENEPIVHTPGQAIDCFERTKMDGLGIGPFWLEK